MALAPYGLPSELTCDDMRDIRRGYYEYTSHTPTLDGSPKVNLGQVIQRAQLPLEEGLRFLGYVFPEGSCDK